MHISEKGILIVECTLGGVNEDHRGIFDAQRSYALLIPIHVKIVPLFIPPKPKP